MPEDSAAGRGQRTALRAARHGAQTLANGLVVSGEEWRAGGGIMTGDGPEHARRSGAPLARLMRTLGDLPA
ncbi:hypothetical protein ASG92_15185 [Arthrobacter sp. Soil736]|uniref:hypothetical protein n=1 Tax=Arthrobacter sp. Soil736 TaxID=1736395 RepID=UPI0006FD4819|nr:hypothetical protein [Arthrobacter sp. Soil736]KRE67343.1 hypothetical protein ASG92_15185 [Arthrobacter sp. Soil736]